MKGDGTPALSTEHAWLRTALCGAAGCTDPGYRERGMHAPNCMQDEVNLALDEYEAENDRLRAALRESCEDNRSLAYAEPGRTAMCPLMEEAKDDHCL